ncbi:MAG: molybdopterin-synthase adenylyltransferase MoeB [Deferribacteraceae bacterium]|jgi:adenylyltransferase/sulfurtransferase|nr:molybdopterin-synthase adenylyltransferase MoeB [Deferribacteraceae bacterium]
MSVIPNERLEELTKEEFTRYSRHLILAEVGLEGQQRLKAAKVLIAGTGGLGAPLALYLAAAGVGTIGVLDFDFVEESNLQRQIIHTVKDVDRPKVASARDKILAINPHVNVITHNAKLTSANALSIIEDYDIVADGTDNFPARYLINDACVMLGKPNVYGSILQFEGQASVFYAKQGGACYRCLFAAPPPPGLVPSCGESGVIGVLPGIIGTIQAGEVIKLIIGGTGMLVGRLLLFDAWNMKFRELKLNKNPNCPICGENPTIHSLIDYEEFCGLKPKDEAPIDVITAKELKARLDAGDELQIVDIREPHEQVIFRFPKSFPIPLGQISRRKDELDESKDTVFICKIGQRSIFAIRALREAGYSGRLFNLQDGVNAWARDIDPSLPVY